MTDSVFKADKANTTGDSAIHYDRTTAICTHGYDAIKLNINTDKVSRGKYLCEALDIINGERQDQYGNPEDSFAIIAAFWNTYLKNKVELELKKRNIKGEYIADITPKDVAMMMTLFKMSRELNSHKDDNIIDAIGYMGLTERMK